MYNVYNVNKCVDEKLGLKKLVFVYLFILIVIKFFLSSGFHLINRRFYFIKSAELSVGTFRSIIKNNTKL